MKYNSALDGIRAIAILMVMGFHAMVPRTWGGYLGVDVFFVLSGFLITSLLLAETSRTGTINLKKFYTRRFARLTPPLIAMLLIYLLLARFAWPEILWRTDLRDALAALFYFADYTNAFWGFPVNLRHTWSLSVEEHFYIVWPTIVLLLLKLRTFKQRLLTLGVLYFVFTLWRVAWELLSGGHSYDLTYYRFDTRLSGLLIGALLAFLFHTDRERVLEKYVRPMALLPFIVLFLFVWRFTPGSTVAMTIGITVVEAVSIILIYCSMRLQSGLSFRLLSNPVTVFIGRMSYGLYLWHYPIFHFMWDRYKWYETLLVGGGAALLLAVLSYYTIERFARERAGLERKQLAAA